MATRKKAAEPEFVAEPMPEPAPAKASDWRCRDCNALNDDIYGACVFCGESRP